MPSISAMNLRWKLAKRGIMFIKDKFPATKPAVRTELALKVIQKTFIAT
jgi:hypothetical protein